MNPNHHLNRSQLYLDLSRANITDGDFNRAAVALTRAASHAATAAAVHWHHRHYSRRRLNVAISGLAFDGYLPYRHVRTFRDVYSVPARITLASPDDARRILRTAHRRVARLLAAVESALARYPNPPTLDEIVARTEAQNLSAIIQAEYLVARREPVDG